MLRICGVARCLCPVGLWVWLLVTVLLQDAVYVLHVGRHVCWQSHVPNLVRSSEHLPVPMFLSVVARLVVACPGLWLVMTVSVSGLAQMVWWRGWTQFDMLLHCCLPVVVAGFGSLVPVASWLPGVGDDEAAALCCLCCAIKLAWYCCWASCVCGPHRLGLSCGGDCGGEGC